jgi:hypothetical protein
MRNITYQTDWLSEDDYTVTVTAMVQDGRSCGAYLVSHAYNQTREHEAVAKFLQDLAKRNQEIHPD